jgi:hypothetical protein
MVSSIIGVTVIVSAMIAAFSGIGITIIKTVAATALILVVVVVVVRAAAWAMSAMSRCPTICYMAVSNYT